MEIKIKENDILIDATIEVVDGVMIVSPKEEKADIANFRDGDVITCGYHDCGGFQWTAILRGEIEDVNDMMFIGDYCSLDCEGEFLDNSSGSDSATWVRYATEEEKKKLFDKLKEKCLEWDAEKKEFVKLRWKPKIGETYYRPDFLHCEFVCYRGTTDYNKMVYIKDYINKGWMFPTKEKCEQFCAKLNKEIECVKP